MTTPAAHGAHANTKVRWIVLALILLASFVSYLLRTNMSVVGSTVKSDLGLSKFQLGMVFSAFAAGYAIFQFPGGLLGDRFGSRFSIALIAVAWGVLTILTGLVPGSETASVGMVVATLIAMRFLVGVVHAPIFPVIGGTIGNWFPVGGWGLPNGLSSTGLTLGAAAAGPLIVWLMEDWGWRGSFFLTAPVGFATAAIWWWYVRDYPKDHPKVGAAELALIDANRPPPHPAAEDKGVWKHVLANREILLLTLSYFCMNYVFYLFFNWFFFYLEKVKEFDPSTTAAFSAAQWIIGGIGATVGGFACDRLIRSFGLRRGPQLLAIPSLIFCALFLFLGATSHQPYLALVLLCISFGWTQVTEAAYWSTTIAVAGRHSSLACGVLNTGANVVGFVGGMLVPVTAEVFNWEVAIWTGSLFALIGAGIWFFIRGDESMEQA